MYKRFCERAEKFSAEVRKVLCRSFECSLESLETHTGEAGHFDCSRIKTSLVFRSVFCSTLTSVYTVTPPFCQPHPLNFFH